MKSSEEANQRRDTLIRVLSAHHKSLVESGSSEALLSDYSNLLRYLRTAPNAIFDHHKDGSKKVAEVSQQQIETLMVSSLEELDRIVVDEQTPRRVLEVLAISRFSVPSGSMRSYSNRRLLVEKLRSLIRNEQAHLTIGELARHNS